LKAGLAFQAALRVSSQRPVVLVDATTAANYRLSSVANGKLGLAGSYIAGYGGELREGRHGGASDWAL